jgi:UDP-glucose 4-epimerase
MSRRPEWWLKVLAKIWPITWISAKATNWPVLGPVVAKMSLPLFSGNNLNITYLPISAHVNGPGGMLLPVRVVEELIRRSSYHAIIKRCTCRDARQCQEHAIENACTFLGEGVKEMDPGIARHVTADEAIAHLHRCVEDGLVPMAGRVKIDNYIWGVRDRGRLLTICYCCHCCCTLLTSLKYLPKDAADSLVRLKGLSMTVDHELCDLCGTCISECHAEAIFIEGDRIVHDESKCKGCGRCASVCPQKAVNAEIENIDDAVEELMGRIERMIDIG